MVIDDGSSGGDLSERNERSLSGRTNDTDRATLDERRGSDRARNATDRRESSNGLLPTSPGDPFRESDQENQNRRPKAVPSHDATPRSSTDRRHRREEYLGDLPGGCGCTEIWEYLSEYRTGQADTNERRTDG